MRPTPRSIALDLWRNADPWLRNAALVFAAMAPISAVLVFLDPRTLDGSALWLKPLKFQISMAILTVTIALMTPLATPAFRHGLAGRIVTRTALAMGAFEVVWITWRAANGLRSHYATDTAFETAMYAAMGVGAVVLSLMPLVLAVGVMRAPADGAGRGIVRWGVVLGTIVAMVSAIVTGSILSQDPAQYPVDADDAAGRIPLAGWSLDRGDLRIAHFVGLHAMQGLFAAGLLFVATPLRRARTLLVTGAVAWLGLTALLTVLAVQDHSPFAPLALLR